MKTVIFYLNMMSLLFILGCQRESIVPQTRPVSKRTLIMGTSADYPPFEVRKEGAIVGFDVDLAREITRELGMNLEIRDMEFNSLIPALQSGHIDFAMAGVTINEERKKNLEFSDVYYLNSFVLLTQKDVRFSKESDLAGKKIGAQLGSTMEKVGKERVKKIPGIKIISLGKNPVLIEELKSGRLDAIILERIQAQEFAKAQPQLHFIELPELNKEEASQGQGYAIAFPKNRKEPNKGSELKAQFNEVIEKLSQKGKLKELRQKWMGKDDV